MSFFLDDDSFCVFVQSQASAYQSEVLLIYTKHRTPFKGEIKWQTNPRLILSVKFNSLSLRNHHTTNRMHTHSIYSLLTPHIWPASGTLCFIIYFLIANNNNNIWLISILYYYRSNKLTVVHLEKIYMNHCQSRPHQLMKGHDSVVKENEKQKIKITTITHRIKSGARVGKPHHVCTCIFYKK